MISVYLVMHPVEGMSHILKHAFIRHEQVVFDLFDTIRSPNERERKEQQRLAGGSELRVPFADCTYLVNSLLLLK